MNELAAYLAVFVAAATPWLEVLLVVPAAIIGGLPAIPTVIVAACGNTATLVPLVFGGDRFRTWLRERRPSPTEEGDPATSTSRRGGRARQLLARYGLPGLAILGPLVTGIHVAAIVALASGADRRRTSIWLTAGIVLWAVVAAIATVLGLQAFVDDTRLPDLTG